MEKLIQIQKKLKAPKSQFNAFGKYKYRKCEDILEAVKPLLDGSILTLTDEIVEVGGRVYVKATATISIGTVGDVIGVSVSVSAFAREAESKKGMDDSQITGSASSYARKYALNGLFLIDDTQDADTAQPEVIDFPLTEKQMSTIVDYISKLEADLPKFCKFMKVSDLDQIKQSQYRKALAALQAKEKK